jgi:hypothetical protein
MKTRLKIPLLALLLLVVSLIAGFAIAQGVDQETEIDEPPITHTDPDPSTDAIEIREAYDEAVDSGDPEAIEKAAEAVRGEFLSRLSPEEKAVVESAPPEADVPADTYAYLSPYIDDGLINQCSDRMAEERRPNELCELMILYGEGKIESGPYSKDEVKAILGDTGEN